MKMDENKKIFPIFLEKSSIIENEESSGYTQSIVEEIKKTLTKFITKSSIIFPDGTPFGRSIGECRKGDAAFGGSAFYQENEEEKKKKTRQAFERMKQYMEETE